MRPKGSRNALIRVTYDTIAQPADGIRGDTARRYAQRGLFDSRDLDSVLAWVNGRRAARGLALIGLPESDNQTASDGAATSVEASLRENTKPAALAGGLVYDPTTGTYRDGDHGG